MEQKNFQDLNLNNSMLFSAALEAVIIKLN